MAAKILYSLVVSGYKKDEQGEYLEEFNEVRVSKSKNNIHKDLKKLVKDHDKGDIQINYIDFQKI